MERKGSQRERGVERKRTAEVFSIMNQRGRSLRLGPGLRSENPGWQKAAYLKLCSDINVSKEF